MKNRFRSQIRNAASNPPKFISFEDFVKQKRQSRNPSSSKAAPQKDASTKTIPQKDASMKTGSPTAGVVPETKKVTDLDLKAIEAKRKEALGTLSSEEMKEIGTWGSVKQMDKTIREPVRRERPRRGQPRQDTRNLKTMEESGLNVAQPLTLRNVQIVEKVAPTMQSLKQAKIVDLSADENSRGGDDCGLSELELVFMLQLDKSIMTIPSSKRLFAYLFGTDACSSFSE